MNREWDIKPANPVVLNNEVIINLKYSRFTFKPVCNKTIYMNKTTYWLGGIVIVALLVYLIVIRVVPSSATQDDMVAVTCTGKTVYRYKNPDNAFPVIIKDYTVSLQAASGVLNKLAEDTGTSSLSLGVKSNAQALVQTLDQDNIFYQNTLKAYFIASNNDPCNDSLRYLYTSFIKDMTEKEIQLKQFISQVTTPPATQPAADDTGTKKVLAVVDTSKGKVDTTAAAKQAPQPNKLIVLRNFQNLNKAVKTLSGRYTPVKYVKPPAQ